MKKINFFALAILGLLSSTYCHALSCTPEPTTQCGAKCIKKLQKILDSYRQSSHTVGMQMTISTGNLPLQTFCSGYTTQDKKVPVTEKTLFSIGSCTKNFTAAIILKLAAENKLKLDDTLGKWLPNNYPAWNDITIHQLLNMTAGVFDYSNDYSVGFVETLQTDLAHYWTAKELADLSYKEGPTCLQSKIKANAKNCPKKPGQGWAYSNTNYILLEMIAEKTSGKSFAQLMKDKLFTPLDLTNTIYNPELNPTEIKNMAHGYGCFEPWKGKDVTSYSMSAERADGGIISNSQDLAKWTHALFAGKVLSSEQFKNMTSIVSPKNTTQYKAGDSIPNNSKAHGYGYGISKNSDSLLKQPSQDVAWGHTGAIPGYGALFAYFTNKDFVIAITANSALPIITLPKTLIPKIYASIFH